MNFLEILFYCSKKDFDMAKNIRGFFGDVI